MQVVQAYETTILDTSGKYGFKCITIPSRSALPRLDADSESNQRVVADLLEVKLAKSVSVDQIVSYLGRILAADNNEEYTEQHLAFAQYASYARVIPFEQSPLGAESLAGIAANAVKAGAVTLGATIGLMAAGGTPFVLITVPAGIILCGAAVSFSKWAEENREKIWSKLLGVSRTHASETSEERHRKAVEAISEPTVMSGEENYRAEANSGAVP